MFEQLDNCIQVHKLKKFGPFEMRPMFEGFGLFKNGMYFGTASHGSLFFRVDENTKDKYVSMNSSPLECSFYKFENTYKVPDTVTESEEMLCQWAEEAYQIAVRQHQH